MKQKFTLVEFCAGTGAFSLGLKPYVVPIFANDLEPSSKIVFQQNFPATQFVLGDATEMDLEQVPVADIFTSGFPCQPFSISGKREGFDDARTNMFFTTVEYMRRKQPKLAILENVKNILSHDNGNTLRRVLETIRAAGYSVSYQLLDTAVYLSLIHI